MDAPAPPRPRARQFLVAMAFFAFGLRIGFAGYGRDYIERTSETVLRDTVDYRLIAHHLLSGHGLAVDALHIATRPPLYPILLAGVYGALGDGYWPSRAVQALLQLAGLALLFRLARDLFDDRVARGTALLYAVNPFFVFYAGFELTETLALVLCIATAAALRAWQARPSAKAAFAIGVLLGLTHLCRPTLGWAAPLLAAGLLIEGRFRREARAACVLGLAGFALVVAPWVVRNRIALDAWVVGNSGTGQIFYSANNPRSVTGSAVIGVDYDLDPEVQAKPELERDRIYTAMALDHIRAEPGLYLRRVAWRFYRLWQPVPYATEFSGGAQAAVAAAGEGVLLPFFVAGLWLARRRWRELLYVYALGIALSAVHALVLSGMRYRVPVMPFVLMLAAVALVRVWELLQRPRQAPASPA